MGNVQQQHLAAAFGRATGGGEGGGEGSGQGGQGGGNAVRSWADVEAAQQAAAANQRHRLVSTAIRTANGASIARAGPSMKRAGGVRVGASLVPGSTRREEENLVFEVRSDVQARVVVVFAPEAQDEAPFFVSTADAGEVALLAEPGTSTLRTTIPNEDALSGGVAIRLEQDTEEDWARAQCVLLDADLREKEQSIVTREGRLYKLKTIFGGNHHDEVSQECVICLTNPQNTTILPCMHMCLCTDCAKQLTKANPICPLCRTHVAEFWELPSVAAAHGSSEASSPPEAVLPDGTDTVRSNLTN